MFAYQFLVYDPRPSQLTGDSVMFDNVIGFVITNSNSSYDKGGYAEYQPGAAQTRWDVYAGKSWQDDGFAGVHPRIRSWPRNSMDSAGKWSMGVQYANSYKTQQAFIKPMF